MSGGASIQLPMQLLWVDKDYAIVRSEYDFGLGRFLLFRTTKEAGWEWACLAAELCFE